jgi:NAD(P)-dependent dehydrogenase (short-subunit alcohol dehydrogenase family)
MSKPVALVTGASRGIGEGIVFALAKAGYDVALAARSVPDLNKVAAEAQKLGAKTVVVPYDAEDLASSEACVRKAAAAFGRLDVLVNNAAWREIMSMRQITPAGWDKTLRICITSPAFMARWAAEEIEKGPKGRGGCIFNVSSVMAVRTAGVSPAYCACKGAMDSLTYELASLYGPSNIRVIGIAPGAIDTEMGIPEKTEGPEAERLSIVKFALDMIALQKQGVPANIGALIAALAGEAGAYVTGTVITADGGWVHQHFPLSHKQFHFPKDYPR